MSTKKFDYRVTFSGGGDDPGINLEWGAEFSELPISDDAKLVIVGKALNNLAMRLMTSTVGSDEDEDDWDEDD